MKRFRLFDSVKNYYFEITFFIQNMKLKLYFDWISITDHDLGLKFQLSTGMILG